MSIWPKDHILSLQSCFLCSSFMVSFLFPLCVCLHVCVCTCVYLCRAHVYMCLEVRSQSQILFLWSHNCFYLFVCLFAFLKKRYLTGLWVLHSSSGYWSVSHRELPVSASPALQSQRCHIVLGLFHGTGIKLSSSYLYVKCFSWLSHFLSHTSLLSDYNIFKCFLHRIL